MNKKKIAQLIAAALIINSLSNVTATATTTTNSNTEVSTTADSTTEYSAVHNVSNTDELIQALNAAQNGDTINISAGVYNTNINITKSLNLVGADKNTTVINGKITASADVIDNLNITNMTITAEQQHINLASNTNVKSVSVDNVIFNHTGTGYGATMYFWHANSGYDLISVTNSTFNYPNAKNEEIPAGQKISPWVAQTWDSKEVVFSNNNINLDGSGYVNKGFEISGIVGTFTAENNNFDKTKLPLVANICAPSENSEYTINNNNITNASTAGVNIYAWTGNVLKKLDINNSGDINITAKGSYQDQFNKLEIKEGNMAGTYVNTHNVTNVDELQKALSEAIDGEVIEIAEGSYDMTKEVNGVKGSSFIVDKDNITIKATGNVQIYASSTAANGGMTNGISGQNTILVTGENVTLDGLTIMPIQGVGPNTNQYNKSLEVGEYSNKAISTFTMKNCTVTPNTIIVGNNAAGYGGQVSINTSASTAETIKIENNTFVGTILDPRTGATVTGNIFDGASPVHKNAIRFRLQPTSVGGANTETYVAYLNNNEFKNIESDSKILQVAVANTVEMNNNTLPEGRTIDSLLDLQIASGQDAATVIIDGAIFNGYYTVNNSEELEKAFADAKDGDTIKLNAGVYNTNVNINKSINLVGPNASVNPNTDTRVNEATVTGTITLAKDVTDVEIKGLNFTEKGNINATQGGNHNLVVENNVVTDLNGVTAFLYTSGATSNDIKVVNNRISGVTNDKKEASALTLWHVNNAEVTGNYIENVSFHGVQFNTNLGTVNVKNNNFDNIRLCAIQFADSVNGIVNIENNTINNAAQDARLTDGTWNYSAIRLYSIKNDFSAAVKIDGNTITNSKFGVMLSHRDADRNVYEINATVNNNKFYPVEGDYLGISVPNSSNLVDFTHNFWGIENPTFVDITLGNVNAFPYYADESLKNLVKLTVEGFGPEGDVTPEVDADAEEGFGSEGDVTPEVDSPSIDGSADDNYLNPNQPVGDGSNEDNMQVVPEDSPSFDPEDDEEKLPETDVTPEDEPSFDLEDETLPNTGGTAASYALGFGGLITAMGAALFRKRK